MEKVDVVVVGAGIAGLTAAYELRLNNRKVVVLEKNDFPGGRMSTKIIDGIPFNLGAQFITPFYENMNFYIKKFDLKLEKLNIGQLAIKKKGQLFSFNGENPLSLFLFKGLSLENKIKLLLNLFIKLNEARTIDLYDLKTYLSFDGKSIYDDLINKVGQDSFDYFIDPMLEAIFGYSSKNFSKALFLAVLTKLFNSRLYSFKNGINQPLLKMANKVDVRTNLEVIKIKKMDKKVLVIANAIKNNEIIFEANKVIIAIPGNKVLKILDNPTPEEKNFFSQVEYSKMGYVFLKTKENILKNTETVWLPFKEDKNFAGFGLIKKLREHFYYSVELREGFINRLIKNSNKNLLLRKLIKNQLGLENFKIVFIKIWDSAVPVFFPGYLTTMFEFIRLINTNNSIFYCGDYLESPSTEGALTSGLKIANLITKN